MNNIKKSLKQARDYLQQIVSGKPKTSQPAPQIDYSYAGNSISGSISGGISIGSSSGTFISTSAKFPMGFSFFDQLYNPDPELFRKYVALFSDKMLCSLDKLENELITVKREDALLIMYHSLAGKNANTDPSTIDSSTESAVMHLYYVLAPSMHPERLVFSKEELDTFLKGRLEGAETTLPVWGLTAASTPSINYTFKFPAPVQWINTSITIPYATTTTTNIPSGQS
jgi:hypothetical protein